MLSYNPDKFASLYASPVGQRCWAFLTCDENIARLETASELGRPAVEGIEEHLLAEFGEDVLADRVKQMVGHMIRQVLEHQGWVLDQADVKIQSVPFSKAARYRRAEWITFHAFRNSADPRDVVLTDRRQHAVLPDDARWIYYATFASPLKAAVAFGVRDIAELHQQVRARGFRRIRIQRMLRRA